MPMQFTDCFSKQASQYKRFRPSYPVELFDFLSGLVAKKETAWDCGTGNGQAALALTEHFKRVIATDASEEQIKIATAHPQIEYRVARAESSGLDEASIDLLTVANAVHWFDIPSFFTEVRRVLRPHAVVALWCYEDFATDGEVDKAFKPFYEAVGSYAAPHLDLVRDHYSTIDIPFQEIETPDFTMKTNWTLEQVLGYLSSWSMVQTFRARTGRDPFEIHFDQIADAWGSPTKQREVSWQLHMRTARVVKS